MSEISPGINDCELLLIETIMESTEINFSIQDGNFSYSTNETQFEKAVASISNSVYIYLTPCLIMVGILGNLLSVYVFFSSKLRLQSTSQYLSALAFSDSLFLLQLLPPWFSTIELTSFFHRQGFCQIFVYISYVTCCVSAWLVVAFTVERFVAVLYPLHRNSVCTVRRSRYVILGIIVGSMVVNIPMLQFARSGQEKCDIDRDYLEHAARFNYVDTVVAFTMPLALIIILNAWIMIGVCRLGRARMKLLKQEPDEAQPEPRDRAARQLGSPKSQQKVTKMLLIVSSMFVVFNMPAYMMRILAYTCNMENYSDMDAKWLAAQHVSSILFNVNFGINFFLYCLSGQNFRRALRQSVPCFGWIASFGVAVREATYSRGRPSSVTTSAASNCTEGTSNNGQSTSTPNSRRRQPPQHYIWRWTFDNSRQQRRHSPTQPESIEMQVLGPRLLVAPPAPPAPNQGRI